MQAEGVGGELRAGYALVARIASWQMREASDPGWHTVSIATELDRFLLRQGPLKLTLRVGDLSWSWDHVIYEDGRLLIEGAPIEGVKVLHGT